MSEFFARIHQFLRQPLVRQGSSVGMRRSSASYTTSVARFCFVVLFVSLLVPAFPQAPAQEPPEEDVTVDPKTEYVLNPLQAEKEIRIGNYYLKKGSNKAAAKRYEEAIKWDPNSAEGWYKLGEAQGKIGNAKAQRDAWAKYLELQPDGKFVAAVKKRLSQKP